MTAPKFPIHPLRRLAAVSPSSVDKKSREEETRVRLCNYTDVYYHGAITDQIDFMNATASADQVRRFQLRKGDILITKDSESWTDIGVAAFVPESLPGVLCGYHLAVLRPTSPAVVPKYLYWALQSSYVLSQLHTAATGVTRFGLRTGAIRSLSVPLPAADHQRQIVDFLDRETARIDELIQAKEHLRDLLAERIWAAFLAELNSDVTREVQIRRTLTSITDGPFGSAFRSSDYIAEGAFVVRLGNIGFAEFREEPSAFIPVELFNSLIRYRVIEGDVIIAGLGDERNHAGRAAVAPSLGNALVKGKCFRARVNQDRVLPEFLAWFLSSPLGAKRVSRMSRGSTRSMINLEIIKAVPLPLPEIAQQRRIVEKMFQIRKTARLAESAIVSQLGLLQERRRALITAAVTGQLDITGDGAYEELEKATA